MLGKLVRHEFGATWRVLVVFDIALIVLGAVGFFVLSSFGTLDDAEDGLFGSMMVTAYIGWFVIYILGLFAINIGTQIVLMLRYYRNLYSYEGYLTFTLPVETGDLLNAKLIAGFVWTVAANVLTFVSICLLGLGLINSLPPEDRLDAFESITSLLSEVGAGAVLLGILTFLVSTVYGLMSIYFSISMGQLWQKHKVAGAVITYIALTTLTHSVTSTTTLGRLVTEVSSFDFEPAVFYNTTMIISLLFTAITSAVFYFIIQNINAKHVNL